MTPMGRLKSLGEVWAVANFTDFCSFLSRGYRVVRDAIGDLHAAIGRSEQAWVTERGSFMYFAADDIALWVDDVVEPHDGCREKQDVHVLLSVNCRDGLAN